MNIFYLDSDPRAAAEYHCDKHVVKMILETAQLLSTAHHVSKSMFSDKVYKATHINHPSNIWVRTNSSNYFWTYELFHWLCHEYTCRYKKVHKSEKLKFYLSFIPNNIKLEPKTEIPQCMPDDCKVVGDSVQAYRNYYNKHKAHFARWKYSTKPIWFTGDLNEKV